MPFLTFQTVEEQRKRRQKVRQLESESLTAESEDDPATVTEPTGHIKETIKKLADAALKIMERPGSDPNIKKLSQQAIRCITGDSKYVIKNSYEAMELLKHHLDSTDEGKSSSTARKSSLGRSSVHSKKRVSTTDMLEAIEYFIDAFSLAENPAKEMTTAKKSLPPASLSDKKGGPQPRQRHESRTLDQYFYTSLPDTVRRDADQVIRRYQMRKRSARKFSPKDRATSVPRGENDNEDALPGPMNGDRCTEDPQTAGLDFQENFKLCMVDQLWLWVLDESKRGSMRIRVKAKKIIRNHHHMLSILW